MRRGLKEESNIPSMNPVCFIHPALKLGRRNIRKPVPVDSSIHMLR
jgi:hypothetical protein